MANVNEIIKLLRDGETVTIPAYKASDFMREFNNHTLEAVAIHMVFERGECSMRIGPSQHFHYYAQGTETDRHA